MKNSQRSWCLIEVPDHQGIFNVGGRLGAAQGPASFQKHFAKFHGKAPVRENLLEKKTVSPLCGDVETNLATASKLISESHSKTGLSVVIGGGHDHGYSHLKGIFDCLQDKLKAVPKLGCINIDAHLDVRKPNPLISSGSPFYLALERKVLQSTHFIEFGIQKHCNGPALWEYVENHGVEVVPFEELRFGKAVHRFSDALSRLSKKSDAVVINLDLDAIAMAHAPGVSAPQVEGFSPSEILEFMNLSASDSKVVSLGIFELNPIHDSDEKTARLAATSAYHFLSRALERN